MQNDSTRHFSLGEGRPGVEGTITIQFSPTIKGQFPLFFFFFSNPQSRDAGDHRAGAAGQRREAGVRAKSRVLEAARSQGEQEEREERAAHP